MATFYTPPVYQGQFIEVSYAGVMKGLVMRVFDRSDRSQYFRLAKWTPSLEQWWDSSGPQNAPPPSVRFGKKLSQREVDSLFDD